VVHVFLRGFGLKNKDKDDCIGRFNPGFMAWQPVACGFRQRLKAE
jgi:hypothetical protein